MKKYWMYRGFGLKIRSEIELPEMIPLEENKEQIWDVVIEYGEVFEKIKEPLIDETLYQFSHKEFACYIEEIGMIHSCEGKKITINLRKKNISEDEMTTIRGFILGVGIGFIAYQKGMIPIHGSTVIVDGQGIIISGDCGSGKTSLCHQYLKCGFTYTADDLSIVELSGSQGIVHHAYPQQRLCKDTAYHWNHNISKLEMVAFDQEEKYIFSDQSDFIPEAHPLMLVVKLDVKDIGEVKVRESVGIEKLSVLMTTLYNAPLLGVTGLEGLMYNVLAELASKVKVVSMIRPRKGFTTKEQMAYIDLILENKK